MDAHPLSKHALWYLSQAVFRELEIKATKQALHDTISVFDIYDQLTSLISFHFYDKT
jgi:hypothetical protein